MTASASPSAILRACGLFGGLADDELTALLPRLRRKSFRKGALVFMRGDTGRDLYIVESGSVRVCLASSSCSSSRSARAWRSG